MTQLNEIKDNQGARKSRMRVGRGIGSGKGKTSGRGGKGQTARTGVRINGFEGGQTPIHRRLPKRGFKNHFRITYATVNLNAIQKAIDEGKLNAKSAIDVAALKTAGLIRQNSDAVKLLAKGALKASIKITVEAASDTAKALVEKAGGAVTISPLKIVQAKEAARAKQAQAAAAATA